MPITTKVHGLPTDVSKDNVGTLLEYSVDDATGYFVVLKTGTGDSEYSFAGVVVHTDKKLWHLGEYATNWSIDSFSEFTSKVSLKYRKVAK